jgi:hypothetical protein
MCTPAVSLCSLLSLLVSVRCQIIPSLASTLHCLRSGVCRKARSYREAETLMQYPNALSSDSKTSLDTAATRSDLPLIPYVDILMIIETALDTSRVFCRAIIQ